MIRKSENNQKVKDKNMIKVKNPNQLNIFDPWDFLTPNERQRVTSLLLTLAGNEVSKADL
jgi:hypothetical protein